MPEMTADQAIEALRKLPEDKQRVVLQRLSPETRKSISTKLSPPQSLKKEAEGFWDTFKRSPNEALGKRAEANAQEAQHQTYLGSGPESQGRPFLERAGHSFMSGVYGIAEEVDKLVQAGTSWEGALVLALSKVDPALGASLVAAQSTGQLTGVLPGVKKGDTSPENVQNAINAMLGVVGASTAHAAPESGRVASAVTKAPELIRKGAQIVAGATPERTTAPMVEEYKADTEAAKAKQAEENQKAVETNRENQQDYHKKITSTFDEAKQEQVEQESTKKTIQERNEASQAEQGRRSEVARNIKQGSKQLGEGIDALAKKIRAEQINPRYETIRNATGNDPGVPLIELSKEARNAEKMIKGSTENIKQFRELIRKAPESEGVQTSAGFTVPGDPLYDQLVSEGAIDTGGNIKFDQLQGYSSEIGDKLAGGNLPGDVYQAMKYLKEKIDAQKAVIAERNNMGPQLKKADADYRQFNDTFYDKPSAVAATRGRVGKLDPEFYAEPFISGKAAQTGIRKLEKYDPQLAAQARSLRTMHDEFQSLPKKATIKPVPESSVPQKAMPELKEVSPKQVEQPKAPTVDDVRERKTSEIKKSAREIGHFSKYDAAIISSSAIGPFFGRWETLLIDPAYLAARKGIGRTLDRPAVQKWLAEPSAEDLRILDSLPEEAKTEVRQNMKNFITEQRASGQPPWISSKVQQFLLAAPKTDAPPETRKALLDQGAILTKQ